MSEIVQPRRVVFCVFHDLHVPIPIQLQPTAEKQRVSCTMYAQLTRCFSAVAELLVYHRGDHGGDI